MEGVAQPTKIVYQLPPKYSWYSPMWSLSSGNTLRQVLFYLGTHLNAFFKRCGHLGDIILDIY